MSPATGLILLFLKATGAWAVATPWRRVYCLPSKLGDTDLWAHEQVHLQQIQRDGAVRWTVKALWYLLRYGYKDSPYEVEARLHLKATP